MRQHPYRETLHHALMLAHYRAGRPADALAVYRDARSVLAADLGQGDAVARHREALGFVDLPA